jgi:hypothetical protein
VGANTQQGIALLVFFTSFTLGSIGMLNGGNLIWLLLAVAAFAWSIVLFRAAKPLER